MMHPPIPDDAASLSPAAARAIFRRNEYYGATASFCRGYNQANLAVIPRSMAKDFEEFCYINYSPLPLLYRSKPGETAAPPLATDSNVK